MENNKDMEMKEFGFEKLTAYQRGKEYVKLVYKLLKIFPQEERYALCDQLRRASISVTSNIAEGMSHSSNKDKMHFLDIAYGSLMETFSQMDVAYDLDYITSDDLDAVRQCAISVLKPLSGLKNHSYHRPPITDNRPPITDNQ